jgi:ribonuclease E
MSKEMLINAVDTEECRIAVMDGGELQELYVERAGGSHHVGNIYKGRVTNIEPGIQAAFIDYGPPKNGFLHVSDIVPGYFPDHAKARGGRKPPIQTILKRNQEVVLQVTKEGIGTKGATLSTYLSIAGRYLVLMPGFQRVGVSRKIEDDAERRKLRELLEGLERPKNMGVIVRTAGLNQSKSELQRDLRYLMRVWAMVSERIKTSPCPSEIFRESDLVVRTIRDIFTTDIKRITVDHPEVTRRVRDFLRITMPRYRKRVHAYEGKVPLFHKFGIEEELEKIYARTVPLPSGGYLVVEQTEALVSIDVNSGKFRSESNPEEAAFKLNLEAAKEIVRQLRLRDLGGVIVMDFVDMRSDKHRRSVEDVLRQELKKDRARSKFLRTSRFGLIEMTRQRMRPSLERASFMECPHCKGSGLIKSPESMSLEVMRLLSLAASQDDIYQIEVTVHPTVGHYINNRKRRTLVQLEERAGKQVMVIADSDVSQETADFHCQDSRGVPVKFDARRLARQQREGVLDRQKKEKVAEAPQGAKAAEAPQGEKAKKAKPRKKRRRKKAVPARPAKDATAAPEKPKGPDEAAQTPKKKKSSRRRRRKKATKAAEA